MITAQSSTPLTAAPTGDLAKYSLPPEPVIFGHSEPMKNVRQQIERILCASVPTLITGESGAGKKTIAQYLHRRICSTSSSFLRIRCSALTRSLATSAAQNGRIVSAARLDADLRSAERITLFLEDVADLDAAHQAELAELLQDGKVYFLSHKSHDAAEVQLIFASTHDLEEETQNGHFRRDLLHLINIGGIHLPPLRNRAGDIPLIVDFLLAKYSKEFHLHADPILATTVTTLQRYDWPGNIRQLESVIKRYVVLGTESSLRKEISDSEDLVTNPGNGKSHRSVYAVGQGTGTGPISLKSAIRELESKIIFRSLEENHWNRRRAAQALNISYRALLYKMKGSGLAREGASRSTSGTA